MGAVYGILGAADLGHAHALGRRLAHRGRDGVEWSPGRDLVLGARGSRLFVDLQEHGPIAFDGAIDNRREVARSLGRRDAAAIGPPEDAQLVFELVSTRGPEGLAALAGPFAAALWLGPERRLLLVRDRVGYAPLYLALTEGRIAFASEYKALLALEDVPARPNFHALQTILATRWVEPGATCLEEIYPVAPGTCLEIRPGRLSSLRYWQLPTGPAEGGDRDHVARLRASFLDGLRRQTASYGRVGVWLSGGIDSALVAAGVRAVAGGREVHTFSAGYRASGPELVAAERVARVLGTRHHPVVLEPSELSAVLPWLAWHLEEPVGRGDLALLFLAARAAAGTVDLVLPGFGFDRLFAGLRRHRLADLGIRYPALRLPLGEVYDYACRGVPPRSLAGRAVQAACYRGGDYPAPTLLGVPPPAPFPGLPHGGDQPLGRLLRQGFMLLPDQTPVERLYAACGLRMNGQQGDPWFLASAFAIPDRLRTRDRSGRHVLLRACADLLPPQIAVRGARARRPGVDPAMADALDRMAADLLSPGSVRERGMFHPAYVARLLRRTPGQGYSRARLGRLWSLLLTELWSQAYLDRRGAPPAERLPPVRRLEPSAPAGAPAAGPAPAGR